MSIFLGISGRFIFFTADTARAGAPAKPASDFSSLFCASICVTISFMLVSNTIPPSPFLQAYCEPCLHGKLNPVHRCFQNTCLMFPQILELDLKCQVHFLKNPHRRQNIMLHKVYKSVCCQILQLNNPPSRKLQTFSSLLDTKWNVSLMICCCVSSLCNSESGLGWALPHPYSSASLEMLCRLYFLKSYLAMSHGLEDLSSLTRDWTLLLGSESMESS